MTLKKLDDDILDLLMQELCASCVEIIEQSCPKQLSQEEKMQYLCRALTEILGVLIVSSPKSEIQKVHSSVTNWLTSVVAYSSKLKDIFDYSDSPRSIETIFKDELYFSPEKKVKA
jgi:hypothetical protein